MNIFFIMRSWRKWVLAKCNPTPYNSGIASIAPSREPASNSSDPRGTCAGMREAILSLRAAKAAGRVVCITRGRQSPAEEPNVTKCRGRERREAGTLLAARKQREHNGRPSLYSKPVAGRAVDENSPLIGVVR